MKKIMFCLLLGGLSWGWGNDTSFFDPFQVNLDLQPSIREDSPLILSQKINVKESSLPFMTLLLFDMAYYSSRPTAARLARESSVNWQGPLDDPSEKGQDVSSAVLGALGTLIWIANEH